MDNILDNMCVFGYLNIAIGLVLILGNTQAFRQYIFESKCETVLIEDNAKTGLNLVLSRDGVSKSVVTIGRFAGDLKNFELIPHGVIIYFQNHTSVKAVYTNATTGKSRGHLIKIQWRAPRDVRLEDCTDLASKHWYGGPQQKQQYWPIERLVLKEYSYISKEENNCAIAEPYWLNSDGTFYYLDKKNPLFVDQNSYVDNTLCFIAQVKAPYTRLRKFNHLVYTIGLFEDAKSAHEYAIDKYLGHPSGIPDENMIRYPIWSTWARYKRNINQEMLLKFAEEINRNQFPNSQLEIDDLWETCYGSLSVDRIKFPDMHNTVKFLKQIGFRVTIWVHPFINKGCEPWYTHALNNGYLVKSEHGTVETSWWNNNHTSTAYIDFTKPEAVTWFSERLETLKNETGIDGFKFDAGESSWTPQIPILQGDVYDQPHSITEKYVRIAATFGSLSEVRSGKRTQDLPIFVRIVDKDTYWTYENGLPTLITTLLQMNMNGYSLVLPDMVGGNGYNEPPSKELFIRWLQASVFMPGLQFSYVPWDFDNETVEISRNFVELRNRYADSILTACKKSAVYGSPVNPPVWWIAPNDTTAQSISDQYLLGDSIMVAPVLEQGATSRDIYLPPGDWLECGDHNLPIRGGKWLRAHPAPLNTLPFFVKV